jgi:hypothetical protein
MVLLAAVGAGANAPSRAEVRALATSGPLDYSPDPPARLRQLNRAFVTENLGSALPPLIPMALPSANSVNTPGLVPTNLVSTPVLHCINGHQTEDPLSPPCVASFNGDNGGATWRGVSGDEIRLLVYLYPSGPYPCDPSARSCGDFPRFGTYADLGAPPSPGGEEIQLTALRLLQEYFNQRYQTYGRRVHLFAYFTGPSLATTTPKERYVEEADENRLLVNPFAVIRAERPGFQNLPPPYASDIYQEELARWGITSFELTGSRSRSLGQRYPGLIWSYRPALEQLADLYGSYVCAKVVGKPTVLSGNVGQNGTPRRLALLHVHSPGFEQYDILTDLVRRYVEGCGGHIVDDIAYAKDAGPCDGEWLDPVPGSADGNPRWAEDLARLRADGVTTILWPGCVIMRYAMTSSVIEYKPEWILLGSGPIDANTTGMDNGGSGAGLETFQHRAILITPKPFTPPVQDAICAHAMAQVDRGGRNAAAYAFGCPLYPLLRQVFAAIQRAGPQLTPSDIAAAERADDAGGPSPPEAPPCRYLAGDYSCLKDAQAEIWEGRYVDPSGEPPNVYPIFGSLGNQRSMLGCWLSLEGGKRYLPGQWPPGNIDAQLTGHEPCNDPSQVGD